MPAIFRDSGAPVDACGELLVYRLRFSLRCSLQRLDHRIGVHLTRHGQTHSTRPITLRDRRAISSAS
jgi:hypothetical protein